MIHEYLLERLGLLLGYIYTVKAADLLINCAGHTVHSLVPRSPLPTLR